MLDFAGAGDCAGRVLGRVNKTTATQVTIIARLTPTILLRIRPLRVLHARYDTAARTQSSMYMKLAGISRLFQTPTTCGKSSAP
jgi:hypothetical protein